MTQDTVIRYRRAVLGDAPALRRVAVASYKSYVEHIGRSPAPMNADYGKTVTETETWLATRSSVIAGFVVLIAEADYLLLENIAVLPMSQRSGVGSGLMSLAERRAAELGVSELRLYTNEAMTENLAYYSHRGYLETHRATVDGYRRVFFAKRLPLSPPVR